MFITWRIWRMLQASQNWHPLSKRMWQRLQMPMTTERLPSWAFKLAGIGILVVSLQFLSLAQIVGLLLVTLVVIPILLLVFNGTTLGTIWVMRVSEALVRETRGERFDLLGITPHGAIGMMWLIASIAIQRDHVLHNAFWIVSKVASLVLLLLSIVLSLIILNLLGSPMQPEQAILLGNLVGIMALVVAAWLDHIQSIVVAALLAVVLPTVISNSTTIRVLAAALYLWLQAIFYMGMFVALRIIQSIVTGFALGELPERLLIPLLALLLFYLLREALIGLLWRFMLNRYQVTTADFREAIP